MARPTVGDKLSMKVGTSGIYADADLDMAGFRISGVPDLAIPYRPETWQTVEFGEWDDIPPVTTTYGNGGWVSGSAFVPITIFTNSDVGRRYTIEFTANCSTTWDKIKSRITIDGVAVVPDAITSRGAVYTSPSFVVATGKSVVLHTATYNSSNSTQAINIKYTNTGIYADQKRFLLEDEWLATNCDPKGLPVTVKINGVNIPIEEYTPHTIPVAPSEINIPGDWGHAQERPILRKFVLPPGT